jgi:hypothetical protein
LALLGRRLPNTWMASAFRRPRNLHNNGQTSILARDGYDVNDPTATLAVHCGNRFDAVSALSRYSFEPLRCHLPSLESDMQRREFITLLGGAAT